MITTTTHTVENRKIRQYIGLVTGEAIMGFYGRSDGLCRWKIQHL